MKRKVIEYIKSLGGSAAYSGRERTMYVKGNNPSYKGFIKKKKRKSPEYQPTLTLLEIWNMNEKK